LPITRNLKIDLTGLRHHRLATVTVAAVAAFLTRQMMIHLGIQGPLRERLLQIVE